MKNTQMPKEQEVWLAWVAFDDLPGEGKYRPVIVIHVDDEAILVLSVPVTSTAPRNCDEYDIEIFEWEKVPLEHKSTARISMTKLLQLKDFEKKIGVLSDDDWENVTNLVMDYVEWHDIKSSNRI